MAPAESIHLIRGSGIREIMDLATGRADDLDVKVEQPDLDTPAKLS